jgi:threonine/homoserine/homoserine lactone efflux protein
VTPSVFVALSATVALAALTPGPAVTAIVARAISDGARPALALSLGVLTGDLLFLTLAVAGMAAAAKSLGEVFLVIRWLGVAYLAWQAIQLWRKQPGVVTITTLEHEGHFWRNYGAGFLLTLGHVQMMLFYAALLPGFVDFAQLSAADFLIVGCVIVVVIGGINAAYALLAARARRLFVDARAQRALYRAAACLMALAAVLVAVR